MGISLVQYNYGQVSPHYYVNPTFASTVLTIWVHAKTVLLPETATFSLSGTLLIEVLKRAFKH